MEAWGPVPVDVYEEMQRACLRIAEVAGISEKHMEIKNLISFNRVRDAFVRRDYDALRKPGNTDGLKAELAGKYGISADHVNVILYSKKN